MILKATRVNKIDFQKYGYYFNMREDQENVVRSETENFIDHMTKKPLIDTLGHLGYTIGGQAPYIMSRMEKHSHTQEALFCAADPIIVCVAISKDNNVPKSKDIRAFILEQGDVIILDREVWHDAGHGLGRATGYYYLASAGETLAEWIQVEGEEVSVEF